MGHTTQQALRYASSYLEAAFESIIGQFTEDIGNVETGDIEIDNKTPPIMVDYVITWGDIHGEEVVSVVANTKIVDLFFDETITDK